jgi:hypothetical protein
MIKKFLFLQLIVFSTIVKAQFTGNAQEAWDIFNANDLLKADIAFNKFTKDPSTKAQAYLGKMLCNNLIDRDDKTFENFVNFLKSVEDPNPYLYLYTSIGLQSGEKTEEKAKFCESVLKDDKYNIHAKSCAIAYLNDHYQSIGDKAALENLQNIYGQIKTWSVVGTFLFEGNEDKVPVLDHPEFNYVFKDQNDANVKWFIPASMDKILETDINMMYFFSGDGIRYAQTFVESPVDQEIKLHAGCYGGLRLWVNDAQVIYEKEEKSMFLGQYAADIKLQKGYNRILVEVKGEYYSNPSFSVRLLDKNEKVLNLPLSAEPKPYTKVKDSGKKTVAFELASFDNLHKQYPNSFAVKIMYTLATMYSRDFVLAEEALNKLKKEYPTSSYVSFLTLNYYNNINSNATLADKEREFFRANDENSYLSRVLKMNELKEQKIFDEYDALLDETIKIYGKTQTLETEELVQLLRKREIPKAIEMLFKLCEKYPENQDFAELKYQVEAEQKGEKAAYANYETFLDKNQNMFTLLQHGGEIIEKGNEKKGLAMLKKGFEIYPYCSQYANKLADHFNNNQKYTEALTWIDKVIAIEPYNSDFLMTKGDIIKNMGNNPREYYVKALEYDPNNFEIRELMRDLDKKSDLKKIFPKNEAAQIVKSSKNEKYNDHDRITILNNEVRRIVYPEGKTEANYIILFRVNNQDGVESFQEYTIDRDYGSKLIINKAEIIKKDGTIQTAEINGASCTFPTLDIGDAVHLDYTQQFYSSGKMGAHFEDDFNFTFYVPCNQSTYRLLVPENYKFNYKVMNNNIEPVITNQSDGYKLYTWTMGKTEGKESEKYAVPGDEINSILYLSSFPDWNFIKDWYSEIVNRKLHTDFSVKQKANEIIGDKKNLSAEQKSKLIYDYICENINYSYIPFRQSGIVPQDPAKTITTKMGDCKDMSTLYCAIANEIGLKAYPVLVKSDGDRTSPMPLPSTNFNHCIVKYFDGDKGHYLELTDKKLPYHALPDPYIHASCLDIPLNNQSQNVTNTLFDIYDFNTNNKNREISLQLNGKGYNIKIKNLKTGFAASGMRSSYQGLSENERKKDLSDAFQQDFKGKYELLDLTWKNLDNRSDTIFYDVEFNVSSGINEIAGMKVLELPWIDKVDDSYFMNGEKRKYNLNYAESDTYQNTTQTLSVKPESNYTLAEVPQNVILDNKYFHYELTYAKEGNGLKAKRIFYPKQYIIEANDFESLKDFFTKINESDLLQIAFKKQ